MNMRTTLMLMAATIVPAFAQQPVPATQAFAQMAAPAQATAATPEQRAAVFSSLALLPADLNDFLTFTDIAGNITRLAGSGTFPDMEVGDIPSQILALDSFALASGQANASSYKALAAVMTASCTMGQTETIARKWARDAAEAVAATIRDTALASNADQLNKAAAAMKEVKIHPIYGVLTCKPGNEGMLQEWYEAAVQEVQSDIGDEDGFEAVSDLNGFSGVKIDLSKVIDTDNDLPAEYLEHVKDDPDYLLGEAAEKEAATRTLYVLFRQQGNALIAVVCEDPSEIKLAASPAESVLATGLTAEADANLGKGMIMLGHSSPELMATSSMLSPANLEATGSAIAGIFTALGNKDAANKAAYDTAAAGVQKLVAQVSPLFARHSKPMTAQLWCDSDLHLQMSCDAMGMAYTPAPLRHADKADDAGTIAYLATTPCVGGPAMPSLPAVMDAALDIAKGLSLTVPADKQAQAGQCMQIATQFMPEAKEVVGALGTIAGGLDGNSAFVIDTAVAPVPAIFGAQPGKTANMPRIAWSLGVSDRSKLSAGWDALLAASGKIAAKLGGDPQAVGMLPIVPTVDGEVTHYSVVMPFFNKDTLIPTLAVSNSSLIAGTSTKLNAELMPSATGSMDFAGGVCVLRLAPLATALDSLADAFAEKTAEAEPQPAVAKPVPVVVEEVVEEEIEVDEDGDVEVEVEVEDDADVEDEGDYEEDYEEDYRDYEVVAPKSPQQRRADNLREAAETIKACGRVVEAIYATGTTENGRCIIRCDVKLK